MGSGNKTKNSIKSWWQGWIYGENADNKIPFAAFDKHIRAQILKCLGMSLMLLLCFAFLSLIANTWMILLMGFAGVCLPCVRALNIYRIVQQGRCCFVDGIISNIGNRNFIHDTTIIEIKSEQAGVLQVNYAGRKPRRSAAKQAGGSSIRFNQGDAVRLYYDKNVRCIEKEGIRVLQEYITLVNAAPPQPN